MEDVKDKQNITASQMHVIAVVWIGLTLFLLTVLVALFWDQICGRIVLNAFEYGAEQLTMSR